MCQRLLMTTLCLSMLAACKTTVNLDSSANDVELLSHGYLRGDRKASCEELERFDVVVTEKEVSATANSVAEIKARNHAVRAGATHVLLWPNTAASCDDKGKLVESGSRACQVYPVNAYVCIIGRDS